MGWDISEGCAIDPRVGLDRCGMPDRLHSVAAIFGIANNPSYAVRNRRPIRFETDFKDVAFAIDGLTPDGSLYRNER